MGRNTLMYNHNRLPKSFACSTISSKATITGNQIIPGSNFSPTKIDSSSTGLSVLPGKTLALIGSDVNVEGGIIISPGRRIELGSVNSGFVSLNFTNDKWVMGYEGVSKFGNIQLSKQALIDASSTGVGTVQINGANVSLTDGSLIFIQNQGEIPSGNLSVNASESLVLKGASPNGNVSSSILTEAVNTGKGGDIKLSAQRLVLQDGARIGVVAYSNAPGGNLTVNASKSVQLLKNEAANPARQGDIISFISAGTFASGNAGSVQVSTNHLLITDGGSVSSTTSGTGKGSNITVNADFIQIIGVKPERFAPSTIASAAFNVGDAGSVIVNTSQLQLKDGGVVNSTSLASGNAGSVTINARDFIEVTGKASNSQSSFISSSVNFANEFVQRILRLSSGPPIGSGGNVTINTPILNVNQGGLITVGNEGLGNAGKLDINANSINLSDSGSITSAAKSGEGGNISLHSQNLQLRHNSNITATAGNRGNGGNITINAATLVGLENSEISANAFEGRGGNITINTQGLFFSPDSQITATSERGVNGTLHINTFENDLLRAGLFITPVNQPNIAVACAGKSGTAGSSFVNAGRGGIPPSPSDPLNGRSGWDGTSTVEQGDLGATNMQVQRTHKILEAQGWRTNGDGTISFTTVANDVVPYSSSKNPCNAQAER